MAITRSKPTTCRKPLSSACRSEATGGTVTVTSGPVSSAEVVGGAATLGGTVHSSLPLAPRHRRVAVDGLSATTAVVNS